MFLRYFWKQHKQTVNDSDDGTLHSVSLGFCTSSSSIPNRTRFGNWWILVLRRVRWKELIAAPGHLTVQPGAVAMKYRYWNTVSCSKFKPWNLVLDMGLTPILTTNRLQDLRSLNNIIMTHLLVRETRRLYANFLESVKITRRKYVHAPNVRYFACHSVSSSRSALFEYRQGSRCTELLSYFPLQCMWIIDKVMEQIVLMQTSLRVVYVVFTDEAIKIKLWLHYVWCVGTATTMFTLVYFFSLPEINLSFHTWFHITCDWT
jgi:hypothetical protein